MFRISSSCAAILATAGAAAAQCQWDPAFGAPGAHIEEGLFEPEVNALLDGGAVAEGVYIGGLFAQLAGVDTRAIGLWDGASFSGLASGLEIFGPPRFENPPYITDMVIHDDGSGPQLYVIGNFNTADPDGAQIPADQVARWDGASWSNVGGGLGPVSPFGGGPQPYALEVFQGDLFAGGFLRRGLGSPVDSIGRWDGAMWHAVDGPFLHPVLEIGWVTALAVFDGDLYAAGIFTEAPGGAQTLNIARYDGETWSALGAGIDGEIRAMTVYDDGAGGGPALYVGGAFESAGGIPAQNIARWDGASWSAVGAGITRVDPSTRPGGVYTMTVFDDGAGGGMALYVGGQFSHAGGQPASHLARWDGAWTPIPGTIDATSPLSWMHPIVRAMTATDVAGRGLIIGGFFDEVGDGIRASSMARLTCATCYADCDKSGSLDFFDFLCFQNHFAARDPRADCDTSGDLDFFDFLCFQNTFAAGCP